jgi:glycosyltransferase involved in cell wall biosynthesis
MQKFSILFLSNAYPDFESSHHGIFIKKMATLLQKEGYGITVVTPKIYKKSKYFENQEGIKVYRFPFFARNKLLIEYERIPYLRMVLYYISGFFLTLYVLFSHRCRLIHAHWAIPTGLIGILAGTLFKKPVIVTIHGSDFRMAMEGSVLLKKLFIYVCKKARHVNCVSGAQKKEIEELGIAGKKISIIPMGVERGFREAGRRRKRIDQDQSVNVISNRNLSPIYNVSQLIRAIPLVLKEELQTRFFIAGDGQEREKLEKEAKELNVEKSVQFLGSVPHEEMPDLLTKADIYVSTSLYDGTSVSLLEAMAAGAFPVVTDIAPNREWIENGRNGFLFPAHDEFLLAKRILNAIHDKELLEKGRKSNQSIVEERALWPVCIEKIKAIYEDQLHRK